MARILTDHHRGIAPTQAEREHLELVRWRAECLYDAGLRDVDVGQALTQAFHVDLHQVCDAIKAGCPPEQLTDIFL